MARRKGGDVPVLHEGWRPVPDPTVLTTEALMREVEQMHEWVMGLLAVRDERLRGIDRATELLAATVERVPTAVQAEVGNLRAIMVEKFDSVGTQFKERDVRQEREARDNKLAVDAAFEAQEKQAAAQNKSNAEAINKSELATAETINKLGDAGEARDLSLSDKIDDLRARMGTVEASRLGFTQGSERAQNEGDRADRRSEGKYVRAMAAVYAGFAAAGVLTTLAVAHII